MDNLCKDIFLRSKMDTSGFIPVSVIANFNRVSASLLQPEKCMVSQCSLTNGNRDGMGNMGSKDPGVSFVFTWY